MARDGKQVVEEQSDDDIHIAQRKRMVGVDECQVPTLAINLLLNKEARGISYMHFG
jgi:hypothetical protein